MAPGRGSEGTYCGHYPFSTGQPASLSSFDHVLSFVLRTEARAKCKTDIFARSALLELTCDNNQVISVSDRALKIVK